MGFLVFLCLLWPFSIRRRTAFSDRGSLNEIRGLPIPVFVPLVAIQEQSGGVPRIPVPPLDPKNRCLRNFAKGSI